MTQLALIILLMFDKGINWAIIKQSQGGNRVNNAVKELVENGFLEQDDHLYWLSDKGRRVVDRCNTIFVD